MNCPQCDSPLSSPGAACSSCGHRPRSEGRADSWSGRVVEGRYRVLDCVGRGGMGEVYRVEHIRMGKIAAMKLLHPELAREPEVVARFQREAKAVSRLSHPHTVQVFDFGEHEGALYLVMEYVKGRDLGSLSREAGELPYDRALPLVIQLCLALEEAHDAGIVHRDVKPENVLVTRGTDGTDYIKVLDFGLAQFRETKDSANITAQGNVIGTPYYMAPEQIRGESVDHRADIYAIGATLYRLITGVVPFPAKTPVGVLTKCLTEPLMPPCRRRPDLNIPGELEAVIMRAMAKTPGERYQTTRALRKALEACISTLSVPQVRVLAGAQHKDAESASSMPAIAVASSPFTSGNNLRREDLDVFERRLKRRRVLSVVLPLLVLAGVGAGVAFWVTKPEAPTTGLQTEREPNSTPEQANPIARGRTVRGQIGKRLSETQSDVDVFAFEVKAEGAVVLSARLTGIPYIDLSLQIYDFEGRELAAANNGPARSEEVLPNLVATRGRYFAVVQEVAGKNPGTNIDDWYRLTIDWRPLGPGEEVEPNDSLERANRIHSGDRVEGYLARADDVDMFRPEGDGGGAFSVSLSGVPGANHRLRVVALRRAGLAEADLPQGTRSDVHLAGHALETSWMARAVRGEPGEAESIVDLPWPKGEPAPLIIVSRDTGGGKASPYAAMKPYQLTYTFHRGRAGVPPVPPRAGAASPREAAPGSPAAPMRPASAPPSPWGVLPGAAMAVMAVTPAVPMSAGGAPAGPMPADMADTADMADMADMAVMAVTPADPMSPGGAVPARGAAATPPSRSPGIQPASGPIAPVPRRDSPPPPPRSP